MFSPRPPRWSQRACARSWRIRRPWKAGSLSWLQRPGFDMFRLKVGALWAPWNPRVYHWLIIILLVNMAILGGKLAVSRCGKIIWKVLRRCKEYPLCATAISLKYTELYRIIFCVDDKSIDYLIIQFWTASGKPHSCHAFALCMVKDCAEAVDARPNPDMKTQSVYSFGRPSARSRMADASGSVRWSSYVMAQSCSLY